MKTIIRNLLLAVMLIAASIQTHAQGTLVYDQESATGPVSVVGNGNADGLYIQEDSPLLQSFIPSLSAIGFVQLEFEDVPDNGNNGATVYLKLWAGSQNVESPSETLLGSTVPVYMPNGFMNSGLGVAGITNFYFSTLVALTPGQTYYLQPVVLSGDDPWAIVTIGDTYPNGQVFVVNGAGFSTDMWFREGIVSAPEPSTLALIGLGSIFVLGFKRRRKLVVLMLLTSSVLPIHAADSVVQATAEEVGLAPVSAAALSDNETFWVMSISSDGDLIESPYPFLPPDLSALPIYSVTNDIYMVDNTGGQVSSSAGRLSIAQAAATVQTQAEDVASLIDLIQTNGGDQSFQPDGFTPMVYTNGLWLESWRTNQNNLWLRLHGTVSGDNYQLLSTTNLSNSNWDLGQILFYASDGYADFSAVPRTNKMTFFRAHHANPVMWIVNVQNSEELNPTNTGNLGYAGSIYIYNEGSATNDVTVYYTIGGTAQNGIDYSNLTGTTTVPLNQGYAKIDIDPLADGLKPDQTVILTLLQNTNYLIDPANYSATNTLLANPEVYPTLRGDLETPCPNTPLTFNLASDANDPRDPSGLSLTYSIVSWPTHGTLITNGAPPNFYATYTPTNCYEGQDGFTFTASDGQFTSTPATVTLTISDYISGGQAYAQVCRGASAGFKLSAWDDCGETLHYVLLSNPLYGTATNASGLDTDTNYVYTSTGTNFTGQDSFNYVVYSDCGGDAFTSTVIVTVGDLYVYPNPQSVMTGTNQRVAITLSASDNSNDACNADTNYCTYTVTSGPTNGTLSGSGANLVYAPNHNYEGMDSFQFNVHDGVWPSIYSAATVTLYVAAGPILTTECDPFGTAALLDWTLDDTVSNLWQQDGLNLSNFIVYRSTNSGGPYTAIATNAASQMYYFDPNTGIGQTNYYVVNFESSESGITYASPDSNEAAAVGYPDDLIPANAVWDVTDVTDTNNPVHLGDKRAPFSSVYPSQYASLYPWPNTNWPINTIWSNHIALYIPTNVVLSQVQYSIAIDNNYWLYLNGSTNYIDELTNHEGYATWASLQSFDSVAPNLLHYGTNDIRVVIQDRGLEDYFSMVVTTNTCGW